MIVKHTDDVSKLLDWNGNTLLALLEDAETFYQKNCFGGFEVSRLFHYTLRKSIKRFFFFFFCFLFFGGFPGPWTYRWIRAASKTGSSSRWFYNLPEQCPRGRKKGHYVTMVRGGWASWIWLQEVHEYREWATCVESWRTSIRWSFHGKRTGYIEG